MLFHTWDFIFFFSLFMLGYVPLRRTRFRIAYLLLASYIFYGWWDPRFLILILTSTTVDFFAGWGMSTTRFRKTFLVISLTINLGILCTFKYLGFLTENLQLLFNFLNLSITIPEHNILLPVGISFFTFQSMSYTIDVYFRNMRREKNFIRYAAFVALFPQLVAGPIERASALLPQLRHVPLIRKQDVSDGISLFITGLFKKAVMADFLAIYVDRVYSDPSLFGAGTLIGATVAFAWQIYFDFSGYSDMARGIARTMGIRLMLNFNNPYTAVDVRDFWRRWHISLSSWFKDYVYIPLGGNRGVRLRVWWNVLFTMLVSGFWHGAAWTFIIWGGLNGIGSILSMLFDRSRIYQKIPRFPKQISVFIFICITWVFFRAADTGEAFLILRRIFSGAPGEEMLPVIPAILTGMVWLYQLVFNSSGRRLLELRPIRWATMATVLLLYFIFASSANTQFIYFQF